MSWKDFLKIKPIVIGSNFILTFVVVYLFCSYYHLVPEDLAFLKNNAAVFIAWLYLMVNIVAINIFREVRKCFIKKSCPHCGDGLTVYKYKCKKCDREI